MLAILCLSVREMVANLGQSDKDGWELLVTRLVAKTVFAEIKDKLVFIGFAGDDGEREGYLILQKSLSNSLQDRELGIDIVHIIYGEEINSTYGGISQCVLKENAIEIELSSEAAVILGTTQTITVRFTLSEAVIERLDSHLSLLFEDDPSVFSRRLSQCDC